MEPTEEASCPSKARPDGEFFVNPLGDLDSLPFTDIDTCEKMKANLLEMFYKKMDGIPEVINRLWLIEGDRRQLREYADEYDFERKDNQIADHCLVDIFARQLPERVRAMQVEHMPGDLPKPLKEVRDWCIDYDTAIRNKRSERGVRPATTESSGSLLKRLLNRRRRMQNSRTQSLVGEQVQAMSKFESSDARQVDDPLEEHQ